MPALEALMHEPDQQSTPRPQKYTPGLLLFVGLGEPVCSRPFFFLSIFDYKFAKR